MTEYEIRRNIPVSLPDIMTALLSLQSQNAIEKRGGRWHSKSGTRQQASNITPPAGRVDGSPKTITQEIHEGNRVANPKILRTTHSPALEPLAPSSRIIRKNSRWATFRNLCEYYAECVRLDQRTTIHAKVEDEFKTIVCLDGHLSEDVNLTVRTRPSWNEWTRKATNAEYLYLGYPIARYLWKDSASAKEVTFISPVLLAPCRFSIEGINLKIERVGGIRINEGWLERRLKNFDERKAFFEVLGMQGSDDDDFDRSDSNWTDFARLFNHFYHDWCAEHLDPTRITSSQTLSEITKNGIYNRAALIVPTKWKYTLKLHQELLSLANDVVDEQLDKTALRYVFPHNGSPNHVPDSDIFSPSSETLDGATPLTLNQDQQIALNASSTATLSVIVGPPGTGKSRVVSAILANQAISKKTALFASKNHQAIEAVVPRVNALTEPWPLMIRLARPWRSGFDHSLAAAISQLVSCDTVKDENESNRLERGLQKRLLAQREAQHAFRSLLKARQDLSRAALSHEDNLESIDKSFLPLFSKSFDLPSGEVISQTLNRLTPPGSFSFRPSWFWMSLQYHLGWKSAVSQVRSIDAAYRRAFDPKSHLPTLANTSSSRSIPYFRECLAFWQPFGNANSSLKALEEMALVISKYPDLDSVCRSLNTTSDQAAIAAHQLCTEMAAQIGAGISNSDRTVLADVLSTISNQSEIDNSDDDERRSRALRKSLPVFLKHCRLVATTNLSISRDISLEPGLFDLLIVDEASQCDIASVIPLFFRSKRAVIVGDPMQLSHITALSSETDRLLRRQFGIDGVQYERFSYRTTSCFHLANTSEHVAKRISLRQHHRCHPSIAEYCNQTFYRGSWVVLTERGKRRGLIWTPIADDSKPAIGGGATSEAQIASVLGELRRLETEEYKGSIGVVTPFRRQADRLQDAICREFSKQTLERWRMLVNTADGFQGDERDLILMSLVAGNNLTDGSMHFLSGGPNRFNVAVSRAKQQLHIFGDADWARNCKITHIRELIEACDRDSVLPHDYVANNFRTDLVGPVWEPALAAAMKKSGLEFYQQYPTSGRYLDFALFNGSLKLNVEVDGETYHRSASGGNVEADMLRDQSLIAAGWKILRFWVYELKNDINACVARIQTALGGK